MRTPSKQSKWVLPCHGPVDQSIIRAFEDELDMAWEDRLFAETRRGYCEERDFDWVAWVFDSE